MKSAPSTLTEEPPNGVTAGIDWARDDHAVAIVDARGRPIVRATIAHSDAGLGELIGMLAKHGVAEVAIERPDGPVIDTLLGAGLELDKLGVTWPTGRAVYAGTSLTPS